MTLRTHDGSVRHISAICGADILTFDANKIAARCLVDSCLARLADRLSRTASSCNSGLTNTSGGRIITSTIEMRPNSPRTARFRSNNPSRPTSASKTRDGGRSCGCSPRRALVSDWVRTAP
jgi:hypothetical protein